MSPSCTGAVVTCTGGGPLRSGLAAGCCGANGPMHPATSPVVSVAPSTRLSRLPGPLSRILAVVIAIPVLQPGAVPTPPVSQRRLPPSDARFPSPIPRAATPRQSGAKSRAAADSHQPTGCLEPTHGRIEFREREQPADPDDRLHVAHTLGRLSDLQAPRWRVVPRPAHAPDRP